MQNRLTGLLKAKAENVMNSSSVDISFISPGTSLPLLVKPKYPGLLLTQWLKENEDWLKSNLDKHGAILFRGFQINTVEKFQQFTNHFESQPLAYKQRTSPRFEVAKNVYHSTTYPADQSINMHSENSYAVSWPMKIVFCCIQPAEEQGETPIADNRKVLAHLSEATKEKFNSKGVRYVRNISKGLGLSWEEVFQTTDKKQVEEECKKSNMDFTWVNSDQLVLSWTHKAIYDHPSTGEPTWFNHAFFFNKYALDEDALSAFGAGDDLPFNTYYGDGSEISKQEIEEIRSAYEKEIIKFSWQKGDVLFMDNMLVAHGRSPYKGERKIIVSMFEPS